MISQEELVKQAAAFGKWPSAVIVQGGLSSYCHRREMVQRNRAGTPLKRK